MRYDSLGRDKFKSWLLVHHIKHAELAELLGVTQKTIACIATGSTTPTYVDREALYKLMKINILDWLTDEELALREEKFERLDRLAKTKARPLSFFEKVANRL